MLAARVTLQKPPLIRILRQSPGLGPFSACLPASPRFHSCRALAQFAGMWGRAKPTSKVQLLVDLAREVFDGVNVPSDPDILRVKAALTAIPLEELGISLKDSSRRGSVPVEGSSGVSVQSCLGDYGSTEEGRFRADSSVLPEPAGMAPASAGAAGDGGESPTVQYRHIYEDSLLSLGIFSFSAAASIPLHDHPGMVVISRVLYGSLHVQAYDWRGEPPTALGNSAPACLARDQVMTCEDEPAVLFPSKGGNVHQFIAISPCAVLDILCPPYAPAAGRDCTYYQHQLQPQQPDGAEAGGPLNDDTVLLTAQDQPAQFEVTNVPYEGVMVKSRRSWL